VRIPARLAHGEDDRDDESADAGHGDGAAGSAAEGAAADLMSVGASTAVNGVVTIR